MPIYFNPPTPCGVGPYKISTGDDPDQFQSTHPGWGGTSSSFRDSNASLFQSTHPVWGGTKSGGAYRRKRSFQSTHPVWGGTVTVVTFPSRTENFNPPTPCGVGQKTPGGRRDPRYFNPPTPCGVGLWKNGSSYVSTYFNPPTPCGVGQQKCTNIILYLKRNKHIWFAYLADPLQTAQLLAGSFSFSVFFPVRTSRKKLFASTSH